jgi:Asp-tRNA(Asn)/Glu-tRNA(Gln) amidotransferase C subunit
MSNITEETVEALCGLASLKVPGHDLRVLAGMLERHVAAFHVVEELDLEEVGPAGKFEPDWHD